MPTPCAAPAKYDSIASQLKGANWLPLALARAWQMFSINSYIVNILAFTGHIVS